MVAFFGEYYFEVIFVKKKILAGLLAAIALFAAAPAMTETTGVDFGVTVSAAEEHTFTGEVKKVIAVGYLITPAADSDEAGLASQFMVKYSDVDSFSIGDTVTVTYSGDAEVESNIGNITASNIVAGASAEATTTAEEKNEAETLPATETEKPVVTTEAVKEDVVAKTNNDVPATTSTPATGETGVMAGVAAATLAGAIIVRKKF